MITEVSIRCQKNLEVGIRRIPAYTPPQYTTGVDPIRLRVHVATFPGMGAAIAPGGNQAGRQARSIRLSVTVGIKDGSTVLMGRELRSQAKS